MYLTTFPLRKIIWNEYVCKNNLRQLCIQNTRVKYTQLPSRLINRISGFVEIVVEYLNQN